MSDNKKELKLSFAPGCFDNFDGTQEELDELIAQIQAMVKDGSILEKATLVDIDDLSDEEYAAISSSIEQDDNSTPKKLH